MKFNRGSSGRKKDPTDSRTAQGLPQPCQTNRAVISRLAAQIEEIERRSPRTNEARWLAPGEAVAIRGAIISGGAFYIGTVLSSPLLPGDEPALVNPDLPVDQREIPACLGAEAARLLTGSMAPQQGTLDGCFEQGLVRLSR